MRFLKGLVSRVVTGLAIVVVGGACGGALAAEDPLPRFGGHKIEIQRKDSEEMLMVDGRALVTDGYVSLEDVYTLTGALVIVGISSSGGNACEGAPFILSFPEGKDARIDGPIETCSPMPSRKVGEALEFTDAAGPGEAGERWRWTLDEGLKALPAQAFKPDATTGWADLRSRRLEHPGDAFKNAEMRSSLQALLGSDFEAVQAVLTKLGSGTFKGDDFVGSACEKYDCQNSAALLYLASSERRAYVAWKAPGAKIAVYPSPVRDWPEKAKGALRDWAKQWP